MEIDPDELPQGDEPQYLLAHDPDYDAWLDYLNFLTTLEQEQGHDTYQ